MAVTIRITLLAGTYGLTVAQGMPGTPAPAALNFPPSPWPLLQMLLEADPAGAAVVLQLASQPPDYHLPYGQWDAGPHRSRLRTAQLCFEPGTALYIHWPVDLSAEDERWLAACLAGLDCLGRAEDTAVWQVVPSMPEANCWPAANGSLEVLCCSPTPPEASGTVPQLASSVVRYQFSPTRTAPPRAISIQGQANRALFALPGTLPLPSTAGIVWTDRLHRALLQRDPQSALFAGLAAGRPLPEDQRAWYRWHAEAGRIVCLEVWSPQPFTLSELEALQGLQLLFGHGGVRIPLQLLQLDAQPITSARQVRTAIPMLLYAMPRTGKWHRTPAAQAIQSLLWGLGDHGKLDPSAFQPSASGEAVVVRHPRLGRLQASAQAAEGEQLLASRGDRRAAYWRCYHAQLDAEQPLPLLGIGWGRHFGAGRLMAVDDRKEPVAGEQDALKPQPADRAGLSSEPDHMQ